MLFSTLISSAVLIGSTQATVLVYSNEGKFLVNDMKSVLTEQDGNAAVIFLIPLKMVNFLPKTPPGPHY